MLPQVVETVAQQFQQSRHPCMLYIASELLKTYGADQQFQAPLGESLLSAVHRSSLALPQLGPPLHGDLYTFLAHALSRCYTGM